MEKISERRVGSLSTLTLGEGLLTFSDNVLSCVKKWIGEDENMSAFDSDIAMAINGWLMTLREIGVKIPDTFRITTGQETWTEMLGGSAKLESVKTWLYIKARLTFDPPATSFVITALQDQAKELEWRLNVQEDTPTSMLTESEG